MNAGRNDPCPCGSGRKFKQCCLLRQAPVQAAPARRAVPAQPSRAAAVANYNRGTELHGRGRLDEAIASYREALVLDPSLEAAYNNLGNALSALGRFAEAAPIYRRALELQPANVDARYNLGVSLHSRGSLTEAIGHYRDVVAQRPDHAQALYNLGNALRDVGRPGEAASCYRRVVALRPDIAAGHANLGQLLQVGGDLDGAIACYRKAVELEPNDAAVHNNLGNAYSEAGDMEAALASYGRALALGHTPQIRSNFARCLRNADSIAFDPSLRGLLIRAIDEAWTRPADLTAVAIRAIDVDGGLDRLGRDPLLLAILVNAPVCDVALERALVAARRDLLDTATRAAADDVVADDALAFACALARQCAINEYVWPLAADERERAGALRERVFAALDAGTPVPPAWIAAIASYSSLADLPSPDALLARPCPPEVRALLTLQIAEPMAERRDHNDIPRVSAIGDGVSAAVRRQYEDNPYPRWIRSPPAVATPSFNGFMREQFPFAEFEPLADDTPPALLIAGCGTGQEAIETASQFPSARVLAVDLSLTSLAYARRKAREAGVDNVEFGQADILNVASIARTFDAISSVGVLHHLERPEAGLLALLSQLRPGGFMRLGLYSERARSDVVAARACIAAHGYRATLDDIRRCRQDPALHAEPLAQVLSRRDFYSTSECRDLLFHVQEHRYTIPGVAAMLAGAGLRFIGFLLEPHVRRRYAARFPEDRAAADLACWDAFEAENPQTFRGMYRFWVQKPAESAQPTDSAQRHRLA
jgi:tetratricopeptide (TPR) repeat protein/SAM-dependent methyltransferase